MTTNMKIKAIVYKAPGQVGVETVELPPCREDELLCETIYSFVSPGTELRNLSTHNKTFPCVPGYSWVGRVVEVGRKIKGWSEGELVSGRPGHAEQCPPGIHLLYGGHASHHCCKLNDCAPARLPVNANPWEYVTAEVAAISWHGVSIAYPCAGETAVVVGQGIVGAFAAKWLINHGVRVVVADLDESRLERARGWGATAALSAKDPDIRERILGYFQNGVDISVEASATIAGARLASSLLKNTLSMTGYHIPELRDNPFKWPRMIYLATYTDTVQTHPAGLVESEGALVFRPVDRRLEDRQMVIEFIRQGLLPVSDFVKEAFPVEKAHEAYANLREHPGQYSAIAFKWQE